MKNILILLAVLSLSMVGCAAQRPVAPSQSEVAVADCGPYPDNYEQLVKDNMLTQLFDPYSAQYHYQGPPKKDGATFQNGTKVFGWGGLVYINAKNRMGGYVGAKTYSYIIRDGKVVYMGKVVIPGHPY